MKTIASYLLVFFTFIYLFLPSSFAQEKRLEYVVRTVYFLPNDLIPDPNVEADLDTLMKDAQKFYADQMERHGFGRKTFRLETDETGKVIVHRVNGKFPTIRYYYGRYPSVEAEVNEHFGDISKNIYVTTVATNDGMDCFRLGGGMVTRADSHEAAAFTLHKGATHEGVCAPITDFFHVTLHEIGHTFGLLHDFRTGGIMAYSRNMWKVKPSLSKFEAEWLDVHRYFNENPTDMDSRIEIESFPLTAYPPNAVRIRCKLTDPDGLHQVQLVAQRNNHNPIRGESVIASKTLNGKSATVEFITTELLVPTELLAPDSYGGNYFIHIIDKLGNIKGREPINYTADDIRVAHQNQVDINSDNVADVNDRMPNDIRKVSGDNQTGLPNAWLPEPFVVEVLDVNGDPVVDVEVIFRVTPWADANWTDFGLLSDTESRTDANGRAQSFLLLGHLHLPPDEYTPTVHVSVPGVSKQIRFNAMTKEKVIIDPSEYPNIYWIDTNYNTLYGPEGLEWPFAMRAKSVVFDGLNRHLYWIEGLGTVGDRCAAIQRFDLVNLSSVEEIATFTSMPLNICINPLESKLYWTNSQGDIQTSNLDGSNIESLITGLNAPQYITVDAARSKLYWTDGQEHILSANLSGKDIQTFIKSPGTLGNITVADDHLYWTEKIGETEGRIRRANLTLNTTQVEDIITLEDNVPVGIDVDIAGDRLYWTDTQGRICRADLKGSGIEDVIIGLSAPGQLILDIPLAWDENISAVPAADPNAKFHTVDEDLNQDGNVDILDLVIAANNFGKTNSKYDVNQDGVVNILDLIQIAQY